MTRIRWDIAALAALVLLSTTIVTADQASVLVYSDNAGLTFEAQEAHAGALLTLSGPGGLYLSRTFGSGETAFLSVVDDQLGTLPDGGYSYELRLTPRIDAPTRAAMTRARATGDESNIASLMAQGKIPSQSQSTFGYFTVEDGAIVVSDLGEGGSLESATGAATTGLENVSALDFVINDDIIGTGSLCIGFDCVNGEVFNSDTIRLKENNLRIHFDDTSVGSFPANDWRIIANDSASGGASFLAFEDSTFGRVPFSVAAGAPANALTVTSAGRVGLGTATPATSLQVSSGNTPALRLEQTSASGFTPQTWDVAGNETSFFVRDATNGSTLPFRIFPSAPSSSLVVASSTGNIGMGTTSPTADLHVRGTDGGTDFILEEASATEAARVMATVKNNGRALFLMQDTSPDGTIWRWRTVENSMNLDADSGAGNELTLTSTGNMTILGTLTQNSNREAKTNIQAVDPQEVLQKVAQLPIATWSYKKEQDVEHLGPMAQDFFEAFGLGANNTGIGVYDTAGVALAAIQALNQQVQLLQQKQDEIDLLKQRLEALEQKIAR